MHQLVHLKNPRGTTLIEMILATVLVVIVVVVLSIAFPQASKSAAQTRMTLDATNLASSSLATLRSQPYAYLDPSDPSLFGGGNPSCDCKAADFSTWPATSTVSGGTTYLLRSCVNYVTNGTGNTWPAQCPAAGDSGYKNIIVHVFWQKGPNSYSVTQEASLSRS